MNRLLKGLIVGTALLIPGLILAQPAGTITIDNGEASFEGSWMAADKKVGSKDRHGDDYKFSSTNDRGTSKATYRFKIPSPGKYNIEIIYGTGANRSQKAQWQITHEGGTKTVEVNQQADGGKWNVIAMDVPFSAGDYSVQLNNFGPAGSVVVADAVRVIPTSASAVSGFSINAIAAYGGKVTKNPDQTSFEKNAEVMLTAKANDGYVFDGWSGDATGYRNPLRLLMNTNKTVTANFVAAGIGVIMDNPMAEFKPADKWSTSTTNWPGTRYEDYKFSSARPTVEARAFYYPNIPRAGKYDVYIWFASGANRATKVPWSVVHKGETVKVIVNQTVKGGEWMQIASGVQFDAGKNNKQYVEVNNGTGPEATGAVVIADAVAFVYTGE
jgi:uncharacterized repeat protein (TIGR02543 family)